jgi:hypothetical protein
LWNPLQVAKWFSVDFNGKCFWSVTGFTSFILLCFSTCFWQFFCICFKRIFKLHMKYIAKSRCSSFEFCILPKNMDRHSNEMFLVSSIKVVKMFHWRVIMSFSPYMWWDTCPLQVRCLLSVHLEAYKSKCIHVYVYKP